MSDGLNMVQLIGNLGADPELRYTPSGTAVLSLRLATTESYMQGSERQERTEWHRVSIWAKRAEGLNKVLSKGSRIYVQGSIRNNKYQDKDGQTRYSYDIYAREVILLGGRPAASSDRDYVDNNRGYRDDGNYGGGAVNDDPRNDIPDDEMPF